MRPYASLSNNPDLGGRFFIKSNFTKSLTDIEVNLLDNLSEPLSISKLVEKNKDLYDEKEILIGKSYFHSSFYPQLASFCKKFIV